MDMVHTCTHSMEHKKKWEEPWDEASVCAYKRYISHAYYITGNIHGN